MPSHKNNPLLRLYGIFESGTVKTMGLVEILFAISLLIPAAFAIHYGEDSSPFLDLVPFLLVLGSLQFLLFRQSKTFRNANGLLVIAAAWIFVFIIGMIPYVLSGMEPIDAIFESVSGFTTTGESVIGNVSSCPKGILIWRSLTQWIGGIAVILIFMYVLPILGIGRRILSNELSGSGENHFSLKMQKAAKSFIIVYVLLSMVHLAILLLCDVEFFDAICLMLTTISTGGLTCTNNSLMGYGTLVQFVTIFFMFMGGVNFYLHYRFIHFKALKRNSFMTYWERKELGEDTNLVQFLVDKVKARLNVYFGNSEFRFNLLWFLAISVICTIVILVTLDLPGSTTDNILETFKNVLFTVVSLGTTTGFYIVDYTAWPIFVVMALFLVAFFGASAGSTSGGIKLYRLRIAYGFLMNTVNHVMKPDAILSVKTDNKTVDNSTVLSALSVIMMYVVTLIVVSFIVMLYGYDLMDSFGLSVSVVSNGGIGFGQFGPGGDIDSIPDTLKMILAFFMWIGRLEILIALMFLTPSFWREIWMHRRMKRRLRRESRMILDIDSRVNMDSFRNLFNKVGSLRRRR